jgi:uncharacterized protein (UPF0261 family)
MSIGTAVMRELPIGVPKLMVTTHIHAPDAGDKDITMMQTPADILGLNSVMRRTLAIAAGAIAGMVEAEIPELTKPIIGTTALGVTTSAVMKIRPLLEERGYDPIVFHSRTPILNEMVAEDRISGIIDLTPYEILRPLALTPPQPMMEGRLKLAGEKGIPQIIVPGGLDMIIFSGTKEIIPTAYMFMARV